MFLLLEPQEHLHLPRQDPLLDDHGEPGHGHACHGAGHAGHEHFLHGYLWARTSLARQLVQLSLPKLKQMSTGTGSGTGTGTNIARHDLWLSWSGQSCGN